MIETSVTNEAIESGDLVRAETVGAVVIDGVSYKTDTIVFLTKDQYRYLAERKAIKSPANLTTSDTIGDVAKEPVPKKKPKVTRRGIRSF